MYFNNAFNDKLRSYSFHYKCYVKLSVLLAISRFYEEIVFLYYEIVNNFTVNYLTFTAICSSHLIPINKIYSLCLVNNYIVRQLAIEIGQTKLRSCERMKSKWNETRTINVTESLPLTKRQQDLLDCTTYIGYFAKLLYINVYIIR